MIKKTYRFASYCPHCRTGSLVVRNHWFCAAERFPEARCPGCRSGAATLRKATGLQPQHQIQQNAVVVRDSGAFPNPPATFGNFEVGLVKASTGWRTTRGSPSSYPLSAGGGRLQDWRGRWTLDDFGGVVDVGYLDHKTILSWAFDLDANFVYVFVKAAALLRLGLQQLGRQLRRGRADDRRRGAGARTYSLGRA